ncbi:Pycsar system effector family protein [Rhizosphaericola mali]|uniref:HD domain-containing protein n=1 Tax=Rhizosphaericola mali TaxID=2545455 RepID=A0A5P2FWJ9_9BACT|nr:Pycsar system effector family protein [Rhizosphaericola mali]QES87277.1 HD domain-containing protein [Rhizosphaericola mali]
MDYSILVQNAKDKFLSFIQSHPKPNLSYHNVRHTEAVVDAAIEMGEFYHLSDRERSLLQVAAWFHDIGYFSKGSDNHESEGANMVEKFLQSLEMPIEDIEIVKGCIDATRMPQNPHNLFEKIICDADLSHFGKEDFYEKSKLLKNEIEQSKNIEISKKDWIIGTITLMSGHQYFTDYAKKNYGEQALKNIEILRDKLIKSEVEKKAKKEEKKDVDKVKPSKGIETMFRITSGNNQKLSDMADNKAHILITVNSIILSAIISLLLRRLENNTYLSIPTFITLGVSVVTIIFSILATRPHLPSGIFTKKDVEDKKVNLLFFGNFYKMSLEEYTVGMQAVMKDYNYLYATLIKDVYSQGVVLSYKYRLLRIAYSIFMFGLIISVLSFIIATIIN